MAEQKNENRYAALIKKIFSDRFKKGMLEVPFSREDLVQAAHDLSIVLPKNLGDVIYSIRYRVALPEAVTKHAPKGREWIIEGRGTGKSSLSVVLS